MSHINYIEADPPSCVLCGSRNELATRCGDCDSAVIRADELEQWRRGKRRVFWRVRWTHGERDEVLAYNHMTKRRAMHELRHLRSLSNCSATRNATVKLFRVTVKPRAKGGR